MWLVVNRARSAQCTADILTIGTYWLLLDTLFCVNCFFETRWVNTCMFLHYRASACWGCIDERRGGDVLPSTATSSYEDWRGVLLTLSGISGLHIPTKAAFSSCSTDSPVDKYQTLIVPSLDTLLYKLKRRKLINPCQQCSVSEIPVQTAVNAHLRPFKSRKRVRRLGSSVFPSQPRPAWARYNPRISGSASS